MSKHIGDLVEAKGQTWKVYAEQYSGRCDTRSQSGSYVRRHQPFISFKNVQTNDGAELHTDVERGTLPNYALYIPDLVSAISATSSTRPSRSSTAGRRADQRGSLLSPPSWSNSRWM